MSFPYSYHHFCDQHTPNPMKRPVNEQDDNNDEDNDFDVNGKRKGKDNGKGNVGERDGEVYDADANNGDNDYIIVNENGGDGNNGGDPSVDEDIDNAIENAIDDVVGNGEERNGDDEDDYDRDYDNFYFDEADYFYLDEADKDGGSPFFPFLADAMRTPNQDFLNRVQEFAAPRLRAFYLPRVIIDLPRTHNRLRMFRCSSGPSELQALYLFIRMNPMNDPMREQDTKELLLLLVKRRALAEQEALAEAAEDAEAARTRSEEARRRSDLYHGSWGNPPRVRNNIRPVPPSFPSSTTWVGNELPSVSLDQATDYVEERVSELIRNDIKFIEGRPRLLRSLCYHLHFTGDVDPGTERPTLCELCFYGCGSHCGGHHPIGRICCFDGPFFGITCTNCNRNPPYFRGDPDSVPTSYWYGDQEPTRGMGAEEYESYSTLQLHAKGHHPPLQIYMTAMYHVYDVGLSGHSADLTFLPLVLFFDQT